MAHTDNPAGHVHVTAGRKRREHPEPAAGSIATSIGNMADGLSRLFTESFSLARLELAHDVKSMAIEAGVIVACAVLALIGYLFACTAGAIALGRVIGPALGFLVVGGIHLLIGGIGAFIAMKKLSKEPEHLLEQTRAEVQETVHELKEIRQLNTPTRAPVHVPQPEAAGPAQLGPRCEEATP
jgi:hypothetical protein